MEVARKSGGIEIALNNDETRLLITRGYLTAAGVGLEPHSSASSVRMYDHVQTPRAAIDEDGSVSVVMPKHADSPLSIEREEVKEGNNFTGRESGYIGEYISDDGTITMRWYS